MLTILVTGGNRGIGLEICRQLDALGHQVVLGSRDELKGEAAARSISNRIVSCPLDVTDETTILQTAEFIRSRYGKLDVLINNAGIGEITAEENRFALSVAKRTIENHFRVAGKVFQVIVPFMRKTGIVTIPKGARNVALEDVRYIMETNFYGAWRMIQVFTPLLQESQKGRIINVSSGSGSLKNLTGFYPGYSLSKASLNALTIMLSNELKEKSISVNAICPGWVRTDMGGPNAPLSVKEGADTAVWLATEEIIPNGKFIQDRMEIEW